MGSGLVRRGVPTLCAGMSLVLVALAGCGPKTTKSDPGGSSGSSGSGSGGGSGSGSGGGANLPSSVNDFFESEGRLYCERLFRCVEGNDDFSSAKLVLETQARCEQLVARINQTGRAQRDLAAQVENGALTFVAAQAQKCLAELGRCNGANSFADGSCREVFEGSAASGEPCQRDEDCAGDAFCDVTTDCPGKCAPRKQEGQACSQAAECAYQGGATLCQYNGMGVGSCHSLAPAAPAGKGEACTRRFGAEPTLVLCRDGLWCSTVAGGDPNADTLGECADPIAPAGSCSDGDDVCSQGLCDSDTAMCRKITLQKTAGAPCAKPDFVFCDPLLGLLCGDDGTCQASGNGSKGAKCFTSDLQLGCDPGLYCQKPSMSSSSDAGTCVPLLADGATCETDSACSGGGCLNGVCVARGCYY